MAVPPSWIAKLFIPHWRRSQSKEAAISYGFANTWCHEMSLVENQSAPTLSGMPKVAIADRVILRRF
jgi:hypothetical protein